MIHNDVYDLLKERTADSRQTLADLKAIEAEIHSGKYTVEAINSELYPQRTELRRKLDYAIDAARKDARKLVSDYQEKLRQEDELKPEDLNDDLKLLNAGVKLKPRDITAMLNRNADNRTMLQLILRYAEENGIDTGKTYFVGNAKAIQDADNVLSAVDLYTGHWMETDKAAEMLDKFFRP